MSFEHFDRPRFGDEGAPSSFGDPFLGFSTTSPPDDFPGTPSTSEKSTPSFDDVNGTINFDEHELALNELSQIDFDCAMETIPSLTEIFDCSTPFREDCATPFPQPELPSTISTPIEPLPIYQTEHVLSFDTDANFLFASIPSTSVSSLDQPLRKLELHFMEGCCCNVLSNTNPSSPASVSPIPADQLRQDNSTKYTFRDQQKKFNSKSDFPYTTPSNFRKSHQQRSHSVVDNNESQQQPHLTLKDILLASRTPALIELLQMKLVVEPIDGASTAGASSMFQTQQEQVDDGDKCCLADAPMSASSNFLQPQPGLDSEGHSIPSTSSSFSDDGDKACHVDAPMPTSDAVSSNFLQQQPEVDSEGHFIPSTSSSFSDYGDKGCHVDTLMPTFDVASSNILQQQPGVDSEDHSIPLLLSGLNEETFDFDGDNYCKYFPPNLPSTSTTVQGFSSGDCAKSLVIPNETSDNITSATSNLPTQFLDPTSTFFLHPVTLEPVTSGDYSKPSTYSTPFSNASTSLDVFNTTKPIPFIVTPVKGKQQAAFPNSQSEPQPSCSSGAAPSQLQYKPSDLNNKKNIERIALEFFSQPLCWRSPNKRIQQKSKSRKCGVVLTKGRYFTMPKITDLNKLTREDGKCYVTDFIVGKCGCGHIFFPGEIEISNTNLNEIVNISFKQVSLYANVPKPPTGCGLNRRAIITLYKIFPSAKDINVFYLLSRLLDRINSSCTHNEIKFVRYVRTTGYLTIEVDNFSAIDVISFKSLTK